MTKEKKVRDKAAEKFVKERIKQTHLKSIKILGSEVKDGVSEVYILRILGASNYLFKVKCTSSPGGYDISGFIPVNKEDGFGEYRVYNPQFACAEVLKPTASEKKFKGYR